MTLTIRKNLRLWTLCWALALALNVPFLAVAASAEWDDVKRVVAIGDIHGDDEGLKEILMSGGLINEKGEWTGGTTHLVMMGDLVAGGLGSKEVLDLLISLEPQAEKAGGKVHSLLGNHDLIAASGDFSHMSKKERLSFVDENVTKKKAVKKQLTDLFLGDGPYAKWLSERPLAVRINDQLYLHAGLDERMAGMDIDQLNETAKSWVLYFQERGPEPDPATSWVVGMKNGEFKHGQGPAFTRDFKVTRRVEKRGDERPDGAMKRKKLRKLVEQFNAMQMVIGHVPSPNSEILLEHPYYGDLVIALDTRISNEKRGHLSSLEVKKGNLYVHYFSRSAAASAGELCKRPYRK